VLIQTLEKNQKYFLFKTKNNVLSNLFAVCIEGNYTEEIAKNIIQGNKKVLNARLEDAIYYIKIDRKHSLLQHLEKTKKVIFNIKAGSVFERVERMQELASKLAPQNTELQTAILLCKADLQTELTQSFPELQGYIGAYYASLEGYSKEICDAIASQYSLGTEENPKGKPELSLFLALVEKYEKVESLTKAGEIPTSSRDPFGIRRDALAIIKIIIEGGLEAKIKFSPLLHIIILDRLKIYLKSFPEDVINEVINKNFSILEKYNKIKLLSQNLESFHQFKRVAKIIHSKEAESFKTVNVDESLLNDEEKILYEKFAEIKTLEEALQNAGLIDKFFQNQMVIDSSNVVISQNRIALLRFIYAKGLSS
jgi:glycyl-tRNA synthetase beta subunit